uniref:Universal stress protein n=1 Tax=Desulfobacca acetoxidans TaxID=60893 RepID=A0A7C5AKL8_9BACT
MFEKVVLATDLTPAWEEIVACAAEFKTLGAREFILAHVITVKFLGGMEAALKAEAEPKLAAQKQQLEAQGFRVQVELVSGLPAFALNEVARRHEAHLLVVGPQKTSRWQERLLGSVTSAVLHHAQFPLLLLKARITEDQPEGSCRLKAKELLRHVLLPTDFSDIADRAAMVLEHLASRGLARVTVVNALDVPGGEAYPPGFQEMAVAQAQSQLAAWEERLRQAGIPQVDTVFDPGRPLPAVLKLLEKEDISLIVMGTQGKGFVREIFLGSVAHNVARLAPCPVLLLPPAKR